ncbi:helix-turn-helix transcriptional regulator [Glutamicibacter endophyticus]
MNTSIQQQREIYGTPLGERFAALTAHYGLSQRGLAHVLGLSAPMLSQLSSGRRIKIGNPAVYGRLLMLEARRGEADVQQVLREVAEADPATVTQSRTEAAGATERQVTVDYLRTLADSEQLRVLAEQARHSGAETLAAVLEEAGA